MKFTPTRSRRAMMKALLLLWLVGLCTPGVVGADTQPPLLEEPAPNFETGDSHAKTPSVVLLEGFDTTEAYAFESYGSGASERRADLYTLVKLAVDELEFLAGIRFIWHKTEKKVDRLALKLKLKGDISLGSDDDLSERSGNHSDMAAIHRFSSRPKSTRSQVSFRSVFIPKKIKWNFGFDPNDHVAFGELKWGSYIAFQSEVGSHQEVKFVFQHAF